VVLLLRFRRRSQLGALPPAPPAGPTEMAKADELLVLGQPAG